MSQPPQHLVLIVDDAVANLHLLVNRLFAQGYQIMVAESGESALNRVRARRPDLILLDVRMPGIDGFETCRRLKSDPASAAVPVIFLSAHGDHDNKIEGFEAGGVDYITKPIDPAEVLLRVRTHLELDQLRRDLAQANAELESRVAIRTQELQAEVVRRTQSEEEKSILLEVVRRQSEQLQGLINQLLTSQMNQSAALSATLLHPADHNLTIIDDHLEQLREQIREPETRNKLHEVGDTLLLTQQLLRQAVTKLEEDMGEKSLLHSNPLLTLSEREREVLLLIVNGYTSDEVASILHLSISTVRTYRHRIMQKLDVKDIPGLLRFAIRYNLTSA